MKNKIVFFKNDIEGKDTYYYSVKDVRKVNLLDNGMIEDVLKIRKPTWGFMAKELMMFCQDVLEKRGYVLYRFYGKPAHKYIFMLKEGGIGITNKELKYEIECFLDNKF